MLKKSPAFSLSVVKQEVGAVKEFADKPVSHKIAKITVTEEIK